MKKRDYAAEYARRQATAREKGFATYGERRITEAVRRGKTAQQARGVHPREKPASRTRSGSIAARAGANVVPRAEVVTRRSFKGKPKAEPSTQVTYRLSHLYGPAIAATFRKAIRKMRSWLFGRTDAPRVQWRMTVLVEAMYDPNEDGTAVRSTPWKTVRKTEFNADRLYRRMVQAAYIFAVKGSPPEAVIQPLALYLDRV